METLSTGKPRHAPEDLAGVMPGGLEKLFMDRQGMDAEAYRALMKTHHMEVVNPVPR